MTYLRFKLQEQQFKIRWIESFIKFVFPTLFVNVRYQTILIYLCQVVYNIFNIDDIRIQNFIDIP